MNSKLPVIGCFRNGKLLKEVTLLLSMDRSTGIGAVVPSECDRSCTARVGKHAIALFVPQVVVGGLPNPYVWAVYGTAAAIRIDFEFMNSSCKVKMHLRNGIKTYFALGEHSATVLAMD